MLTRISLKWSVPLLLFVFSLSYVAALAFIYVPSSIDDSVANWREQTNRLLILMQGSLGDHLRHERNAELEAELADLASLRGVSWAMVLDEHLEVLASTRLGLEPQRLSGLDATALREQIGEHRVNWTDQGHHHYLALYPLGQAPQQGRALLVALNFDPLIAQSERSAWLYVAQTVLAFLALGLVLLKLYDHLITRRLARIERAARRFARDQQPEPAAVDGGDEIADLAESFSQMAHELHQRQTALLESERLTRELIDVAPVGILVADQHWRVEQANPAVAHLLACHPSQLQLSPVADHLLESNAIERLRNAPAGTALELNGRQGSHSIPLEVSCTPFMRKGETLNLLLLHDITDRLRAEQRLRFLAHFDWLTHLANRNFLVQQLEQAVASGTKLSLLFIDLDHFKRINDTLGHEVGDQLLTTIGRRLTRLIPPNGLLARSGGDEFVMLLEGLDREPAVELAERILANLRQPIVIRQFECSAQASIGVTSSSDKANASDLLRQADLALYAAKDGGRNRYALYTKELSEAAVRRRRLEIELRRALDNREFVLYYQPQVDNRGRPEVMEALLRWQPPGAALVPPGEFVPVLEDSGLVIETTRWVFREACRQAREWQDEGRPLTIAVNLSPLDFRQPDLASCLLQILEEEGTPAELIELEITESALLDTDEEVLTTLNRLKQAGLKLLLDDFGTGYASLTYLQQFPFDGVKIDQQFVAGLPDNPHSVALVRGILTMAAHLGLHVVAEGVENERQAAFLQINGCPSLQGYHYGQPASGAAWSESRYGLRSQPA